MVVLDSSFLIAFHNERDAHHEKARQGMTTFLEGHWGEGLLPEYVFLEVTTVLAMRRNLETAVRVGELLMNARELEFIPCSAVFLDSFQTFKAQPSSDLSFVDAAILTIARKRGAEYVATFDGDIRAVPDLTAVP